MPARIVLRVPLRFELADGRATHAPMVLATVGAIHTRLALDTGSDVHLLTRELVDTLGVELGAGETGTDHAGAQIASWQVPEVAIQLDEVADGPADRPLHDVVVIPAPDAFTRGGIGGALSPQRLDPAAWAVIDQVSDELLLVDSSSAEMEALLRRRHPMPAVLELRRSRSADLPIVDAAIEAVGPMPLLIDTGGKDTEIDASLAMGLPLGPREVVGRSLSGAPIYAAPAGARVLALAGARIPLPSVLVREAMGDPPALLGQDVLRGTVLAVGPDPAGPMFWQVTPLPDRSHGV